MSNTRKARQQAPATTAVVFTCAECWQEWFSGKKPPGFSLDARTCIVGAECEAMFVAHGFEVVPGIVHGTNIPGLFCPHIDEDERS